MGEEYRDNRLAEIEAKAVRERVKVEFICNYIDANETLLREVFVPEGTEENAVHEILYKQTKKGLEWIESRSTRVVGVTVLYLTREELNKNQHPLVRLGWAVYVPIFHGSEEKADDEPFPYSLSATLPGQELVDSLRKSQGYVTLAEKRRKKAEALHGEHSS